MKIPRFEIFYVIFPVVLTILGYIAWGQVGILLSLWVGLFWYSLLHQPRRHELTLIAGLGIIGAFVFLPNEVWFKPSMVFITCFVEAAISPLIYGFFRPSIYSSKNRTESY